MTWGRPVYRVGLRGRSGYATSVVLSQRAVNSDGTGGDTAAARRTRRRAPSRAWGDRHSPMWSSSDGRVHADGQLGGEADAAGQKVLPDQDVGKAPHEGAPDFESEGEEQPGVAERRHARLPPRLAATAVASPEPMSAARVTGTTTSGSAVPIAGQRGAEQRSASVEPAAATGTRACGRRRSRRARPTPARARRPARPRCRP